MKWPLLISPSRLFWLTAFPILLGLGIHLYVFTQLVGKAPSEIDVELMVTPMLTASILRVFGSLAALWWLVRSAWGITSRPGEGPTLVSKFSMLIATVYLFCYLVVMHFPGLLDPVVENFSSNVKLVGRQLAWFALATYILLTYKAATALEEAEGTQRPPVLRRYLNWFGFLLWPIGLWWIQPRVNRASTGTVELALEEHFLGGV